MYNPLYPIPSLHFNRNLSDLSCNKYAYFDGGVQIIEVDHVRPVDVYEQMRDIVKNWLQDRWQLFESEMFVVALRLVDFAFDLDVKDIMLCFRCDCASQTILLLWHWLDRRETYVTSNLTYTFLYSIFSYSMQKN